MIKLPATRYPHLNRFAQIGSYYATLDNRPIDLKADRKHYDVLEKFLRVNYPNGITRQRLSSTYNICSKLNGYSFNHWANPKMKPALCLLNFY